MKFAHTNLVNTVWKALVDLYVRIYRGEMVLPIGKQSGPGLIMGPDWPGRSERELTFRFPAMESMVPSGNLPAFRDRHHSRVLIQHVRVQGNRV